MNARDVYRVLVRHGGRAPAFLASRDRMDHVEIVNIRTGEVELLWDLPAREANRLAGKLHEDLAQLEPDQFLQAWRNA